jgi:hypothetical protein
MFSRGVVAKEKGAEKIQHLLLDVKILLQFFLQCHSVRDRHSLLHEALAH